MISCYNKADLVPAEEIPVGQDVVKISAKSGAGTQDLLRAIEKALGQMRHEVHLLLPYSMGGMVDTLHTTAKVLSVDYDAAGIRIHAILDDILFGRLQQYLEENA